MPTNPDIVTDRKPIVVIPADDPPLVGRSGYLEQLREFTDVRLYSDRPGTEREMLDRLRPADILLNSRGFVGFSREILSQLPQLKMIAVCGIGYDSIDIEAATQQGIVVSNIPGRTASVVAEHAFALMLAAARRIPFMTRRMRLGEWPDDLGVSLVGKQIGIVGTGNIGCEMIRFCEAFGMRVVAWSFHPDEEKATRLGFDYVPIDRLLATSDVVSLHVRLSDQSRGYLNGDRIRQMKAGSLLINTARGPIVDTTAVAEALQKGHLAGAAVDVFDSEPTDASHPLLSCENAVVTPHSADQTPEGLDILTLGCVDNIRAFLDGHPTNVVNPQVNSNR